MAAKIKLRKIGNSLGLILPKEVTDQLTLARTTRFTTSSTATACT